MSSLSRKSTQASKIKRDGKNFSLSIDNDEMSCLWRNKPTVSRYGVICQKRHISVAVSMSFSVLPNTTGNVYDAWGIE
jgi:hypothetical protein